MSLRLRNNQLWSLCFLLWEIQEGLEPTQAGAAWQRLWLWGVVWGYWSHGEERVAVEAIQDRGRGWEVTLIYFSLHLQFPRGSLAGTQPEASYTGLCVSLKGLATMRTHLVRMQSRTERQQGLDLGAQREQQSTLTHILGLILFYESVLPFISFNVI